MSASVAFPSAAMGAGGSYSPAVTFSTPGDVAVNYSTQTGEYSVIGNRCFFSVNLVFTLTYTTAAGNLTCSIPVAAASGIPTTAVCVSNANNIAAGVGAQIVGGSIAASGTTAVVLGRTLATEAAFALTVTNLPTGATAYTLRLSGNYRIA